MSSCPPTRKFCDFAWLLRPAAKTSYTHVPCHRLAVRVFGFLTGAHVLNLASCILSSESGHWLLNPIWRTLVFWVQLMRPSNLQLFLAFASRMVRPELLIHKNWRCSEHHAAGNAGMLLIVV